MMETGEFDIVSVKINNATEWDSQRGRLWAAAIAGVTVAITLLPYLIGWSNSAGREFMWLGYNLDDSCVYLSWMRQSADGALRTLNLFTTDPQHGMAPNPLFWTLGRIAALAHLPLLCVYHGARIVGGFILLLTVWELIRQLILPRKAQQLAYLFVCFASGLGWLPIWWDGRLPAPVDSWQPEAITFLSLYLSPLFCFSMLLQVAIIHLLLLAERTGKLRFAAFAGACGFMLALTHTYDVVSMAAVWFGYLVASSILSLSMHEQGAPIAASWSRGILAGGLTLPAVLYIAHELQTETVFRQRANVVTASPPVYWILLGYGLTLLLAVVGASIALLSHKSQNNNVPDPVTSEPGTWTRSRNAAHLLVVWVLVNIASAYLPVAFQRKLLQGTHFPIAILAGIGAAWLRERIPIHALLSRFSVYSCIMVLILCPTNLMFMRRDVDNHAQNLAQTKAHRTYLQPGEIEALNWLRANTRPGTAVQPLPWVALAENPANGHAQIFARDTALMSFTPGLIDRPVYCGHWGETPDFHLPNGMGKLDRLTRFETASCRDEDRVSLLREMRVKYIVFSQKKSADTSIQTAEETDALLPLFRLRSKSVPYLKLCYSNPDADVYEVIL